MISSIRVEIAGAERTLKFSNRAQARVEDRFNASIAVIMAGIGTAYGVNAIAEIVAASWDDGLGAPNTVVRSLTS